MKKIFFFELFLTTMLCFGQVPQGISYQAIALDGSGNPIASLPIGIRLSILDSSSSGTVLYTETHTPTTNAQGLYNLVIGQGTPTTGTFSAIKWETNSKFLQIEMDAAGGTNYTLVGSTQLLSVPYALYAGKVDSNNVIGEPDMSPINGYTYSSSFMTSTNAYVFSNNQNIYDSSQSPSVNSWHSTPISGVPFMKSKNSFLTSTNAYLFGPSSNNSGNTNNWYSFPISGQPVKIYSNNIASTLVITSTNAYAYFSPGPSNWYPTTITGILIDYTKSDFNIFGVLTSTNAYVFAPNASGSVSQWSSTAISGTPQKIVVTNQGVLVLTSTNAYLYGRDTTHPNGGATYSWHNIPVSGTLLLD